MPPGPLMYREILLRYQIRITDVMDHGDDLRQILTHRR